MKYFHPRFLMLFLTLGLIPHLSAAVVFSDDFEAGTLKPGWSISATNNGRATVTTTYSPAAGIYHLVFDDGVNDAIASASEATLSLNLTQKKNVVLTFKAKSIGNEPHVPPSDTFSNFRNYDGVAISTNSGATWRNVQTLASVPATWTTFSVVLDSTVAALSGSFGPDFRIRFSEYDESAAPIDGISIDDVSVTGDEDQRIVLDMPSPAIEGSVVPDGYVLTAVAQAAPLTVSLSASPSGQLNIPTTVVVPTWETYASFPISVVNDSVVNLTRNVTVTATAPGAASGSASMVVYDDEAPLLSLNLPAQVVEGTPVGTQNASITMDRAAIVDLTVNLTCQPSGELIFQPIQTIRAGQTQIGFVVSANNDVKIDGNVTATLTASAPGIPSANASVVAVDDETRTLSFTLPTTIQEGVTTTGMARISGTLSTPLDVVISSGDAATLTVQKNVTIPAGQMTTSFSMTAVENTARDGSKTVGITASAATFTGATQSIQIRDNEVAGYRFGSLTDIINISSPINLNVSAVDVEGNVISGFSGLVNLSIVLPDGSSMPLSPAAVTLSGSTGWSGAVTVPAVSAAPLRMRATDSAGNTVLSSSLDIMRVLAMNSADLLWDSQRSRIYASVPVTDTTTNANKVIALDPNTLQIAGSVLTGQDPGQLAITSGAENLYVALKANGTIGKISLSSLSLASTFPVGTSSSYGTLYAEDIATVAGKPDVLVVSQYRKSVSPRHNGVAAYENGVIRPSKTQDHTGSNVIEPSADPSIFFGYNNESTEFGFRRLKLDNAGMTEIQVNTSLFTNFNTDMKSDGNKVFSMPGAVQVDGALMKRVGTFPTSGVVLPDFAANRVYFIEPDSQYSSSYTKISSYDPTSFSLIRRLSLPFALTSPGSFIRWGTNGLALRTAGNIILINSNQLVPSDPQTDLAVSVQASSNPAAVGTPLSYIVQVLNGGSNIARNTQVGVTLSDSQTIQNVTASRGTPATSGLVVTLPVGDLASGASATLTITTSPQSAGSLTCSASANSNAIDPNFTNNTAFKLVSVGFRSSLDVVNQLRLTVNNLVFDSSRNLIWASIPATVEAPLGKSIVSIDPQTGLISDPIPLNANPYSNAMAISRNGRYLYVGLRDVPEVHRIDLQAKPVTSERIPLGMSQWGSANYAQDLEVLDGDGTSFLMAGSDDHAAAVYDTSTGRRATRTGIYTVDRIERTATPGNFVGYNSYTSGFGLTTLPVTASGVSVAQTASNVVSGYYAEIAGSGNLLLSSNGRLVDSGNLTLKTNFAINGRPCVDAGNQRAYLVNGNGLRAFDSNSGAAAGVLALPVSSTDDWAATCIRWGSDGFAIAGNDGKIYIARWSAAIPPGVDQNSDGIADTWASSNFGTIEVNAAGDHDSDGVSNAFEYLFATSPVERSTNPMLPRIVAGEAANKMHIQFPRRIGIAAGSYGYEVSSNLLQWQVPLSVTETVLSTQVVNGMSVETIDAAITCPSTKAGFVHLKWTHP